MVFSFSHLISFYYLLSVSSNSRQLVNLLPINLIDFNCICWIIYLNLSYDISQLYRFRHICVFIYCNLPIDLWTRSSVIYSELFSGLKDFIMGFCCSHCGCALLTLSSLQFDKRLLQKNQTGRWYSFLKATGVHKSPSDRTKTNPSLAFPLDHLLTVALWILA